MLLNKLSSGVCWRGGATGLLNKGGGTGASKQQAVEFPQVLTSPHNNTLSRQTTTTLRSNDTLGYTPFQLISDFFHVNKVLSVLSRLTKLPPGVCWRGGGGGGGGGNRLAK